MISTLTADCNLAESWPAASRGVAGYQQNLSMSRIKALAMRTDVVSAGPSTENRTFLKNSTADTESEKQNKGLF